MRDPKILTSTHGKPTYDLPRSNHSHSLVLPPEQRARLNQSAMAREQIAQLRVLNVDFYPRETHLITFRDPWSFPTLFHPACNQLVRKHMDELAQKVFIKNKSLVSDPGC